MPSPTHQILIELFRRRPALMSDLLAAARKTSQPMVLPPGARVVPTMATFTDLTHAEYRADLALHVLLAGSDEPMQTFILEAQLRPDGDKPYTWPLYSAGLRARDRCPVTSIVLALDERTAEWARAPVVLDLLGTHVFRPVVIGPGDIPVITELGEARARPELALLSALVHCRTPGGEKAVYAALSAASAALDRESRALYARAIRALMSEEVRRPLEELMEFEGNQLDVEIFRYYYAQGERAGYTQGERAGYTQGEKAGYTQGERAGYTQGEKAGYTQGEKAGHETLRALLIDQLTERFGALPEVARCRILDASPEVLARWARRVLSAASLDDVLASVP